MMREIFIRTNNLNWVDYLQQIIDSKNETYNSTIKAKPNLIWHPDSFYNNVKNRTREQLLNLEHFDNDVIRNETTENIRQKAKKQIEKNKIDEFNVGDNVRVKMSALYSEIRKAVKQGNKKLINVTYIYIYIFFFFFNKNHNY